MHCDWFVQFADRRLGVFTVFTEVKKAKMKHKCNIREPQSKGDGQCLVDVFVGDKKKHFGLYSFPLYSLVKSLLYLIMIKF